MFGHWRDLPISDESNSCIFIHVLSVVGPLFGGASAAAPLAEATINRKGIGRSGTGGARYVRVGRCRGLSQIISPLGGRKSVWPIRSRVLATSSRSGDEPTGEIVPVVESTSRGRRVVPALMAENSGLGVGGIRNTMLGRSAQRIVGYGAMFVPGRRRCRTTQRTRGVPMRPIENEGFESGTALTCER